MQDKNVVEQLKSDARTVESIKVELLFDRDPYMDIPDGKASAHLLQAHAHLALAAQSLKLAALEIEA